MLRVYQFNKSTKKAKWEVQRTKALLTPIRMKTNHEVQLHELIEHANQRQWKRNLKSKLVNLYN